MGENVKQDTLSEDTLVDRLIGSAVLKEKCRDSDLLRERLEAKYLR